MKNTFKSILPYLTAILIFIFLSIIYFNPLLEGKKLIQGDIQHYKGMSKEISDFREKTGEEALWTNSMFGGMPAYQISVKYKSNISNYLDKIFQLNLPRPASYLFLYFLGFFILLLVLDVDPWLSIIGAIAFAFSSYFFIILQAGHNSKAHAIAYMAPVLAGIILCFKQKRLLGGLTFALFLSLELKAGHPQITYYLLFIIIIYGIAELINTIKNKNYNSFLKSFGLLLIAGIIAIGTNITSLWSTYEYGKETIRGKSELTFNKDNKTSGLDKDYATAWSYGRAETMTLLIPDFMGGASNGELSENSNTYKTLLNKGVPANDAKQYIKQLPLYWGSQPFTSGPVYVGAILCFLFLLGFFITKGRFKWWILAATILSILLAWGHNFMPFTDFFLNYIPFYNKFRTVSMILVIAEFTIPLFAIYTLKKIFDTDYDKKQLLKYLKISFYIIGGITLIFAIFPGAFFSFSSPNDARYIASGYPPWFIDAIKLDRKSLLSYDAFRSFIFILLGFICIWAFVAGKLKKKYAYLTLGLLFIFDLWPVDKRYLNNKKINGQYAQWESKRKNKNPFKLSNADKEILKDKSLDYRVLNLSVNTFNDASTSYFHKSIGGYHGAKLRRYQDLIDYQISPEINTFKKTLSNKPDFNSLDLSLSKLSVLNMLNTKYIILNPKAQPLLNSHALGNAWFIKNIKFVNTADEEITALKNFNPAKTAIVNKKFSKYIKNIPNTFDSTAYIKLTDYKPNHLIYNYKTSKKQAVVFSEIYYDKGWNAYVDGEKTPYFRANYILRAMVLPQGNHKVEFKFEPQVYNVGEKISFVSSTILALLLLGAIFIEIKKTIKK